MTEQTDYLTQFQKLHKRPLLIWHHGKDPWHEYPCDHDLPIWTCSIHLNEIFLDWDAPNWGDAYEEASKVEVWGQENGVQIETAFSGSKSIHQSFYFDPKSLVIPKDMAEDLKEIDVARVVRVTMLETLKKEAQLDTRRGCLDTAKVRFSATTKGSQKRIYGSVKAGKTTPKTWLENGIPEFKPANYTLLYPTKLPELFSLEPWKAHILAELRDEIEARKNYDATTHEIPLELEEIIARPWWKWMIKPPEGFHDIALSSLTLLMKDISMSLADTITLMDSFWQPEEKCDSPSHQPRTTNFQHRISHIYNSNLHFSARRFQEEMKEFGMIATMESRRKFLEGLIST